TKSYLDSSNGKRPLSFVSAIQGMIVSGRNKLSRVPARINEQRREVVDMDHVIEEGSKEWELTLVGYFVGLKMGYKEIPSHPRRMWRAHQLVEIIINESGLYFLEFKIEKGMNFILK
ncbi:zinc knuckle CX2CX4HX4C containing protein, partial [Tanacetum coccineum]